VITRESDCQCIQTGIKPVRYRQADYRAPAGRTAKGIPTTQSDGQKSLTLLAKSGLHQG